MIAVKKNIKDYLKIGLTKAFKKQYETRLTTDAIPDEKIIPIVDDFHFASKKEKLLKELDKFQNQIIIVDDIFPLDIYEDVIAKDFYQYKIRFFGPPLRSELIKKWLSVNEVDSYSHSNDSYKKHDSLYETVNSTLGKIIGQGIMPSYPFFILSIISTTEVYKPLDKEITSQGYCYQALIYFYFRKQDVTNEDIDVYINFLSEISFHFFTKKIEELTESDLDLFIEKYEKNIISQYQELYFYLL